MKQPLRHLFAIAGPLIRLCAALSLCHAGIACAQGGATICGPLKNGYGPFDYRRDRDALPIVENSHFTPEVELLITGVSGPIGGDLDYLLRAFPNHHRGLVAMMRLSEREKTQKPRGAKYPVECYFDRAARFAPNDTVVRALFATFLAKAGRPADAMGQLERATQDAADNPFAHYNIGLVYLEMKVYDKALAQAHRAMELGFPRAGLADALKQANAWQEPVAVESADGPVPADSAASPSTTASGVKP